MSKRKRELYKQKQLAEVAYSEKDFGTDVDELSEDKFSYSEKTVDYASSSSQSIQDDDEAIERMVKRICTRECKSLLSEQIDNIVQLSIETYILQKKNEENEKKKTVKKVVKEKCF